jgi:hypothetical protein
MIERHQQSHIFLIDTNNNIFYYRVIYPGRDMAYSVLYLFNDLKYLIHYYVGDKYSSFECHMLQSNCQ